MMIRMSDYTGPAVLHMPDEDGVAAYSVRVQLRVGPDPAEWHGTVHPDGPLVLTYEHVELALPSRPSVPAYLVEGDGLEIYGEGPAPWA